MDDFIVSGQHSSSAVESREHESGLYARRVTEIPSNQTKRFEWSSGNCIYAGSAARGLAEGTDGWLIQKFTYDTDNNCIKIEIAYGNWQNRTLESFA